MEKYFFYWKKGWKVFLMVFIVNIAGFLMFTPFAIIFHGNKAGYGISLVIVYLMALMPFMGWMYMAFASNETQLEQEKPGFDDRQIESTTPPDRPASTDHKNESANPPQKVFWKSDEDLE